MAFSSLNEFFAMGGPNALILSPFLLIWCKNIIY